MGTAAPLVAGACLGAGVHTQCCGKLVSDWAQESHLSGGLLAVRTEIPVHAGGKCFIWSEITSFIYLWLDFYFQSCSEMSVNAVSK